MLHPLVYAPHMHMKGHVAFVRAIEARHLTWPVHHAAQAINQVALSDDAKDGFCQKATCS